MMNKSVAYKLARIRERFDNIGDSDGVLMCDNLADDLDVKIDSDTVESDSEDE